MSLITLQMQRYDGRDEARFLQQQADDAQLAIKHTLARMQATAQDVADVRWWTQHYPWYAVGGAGLLGFAAATYLNASTRKPDRSATQTQTPTSSSVFSEVGSWLMTIARSALVSAMLGALQDGDEEPATDHQPSAASAGYPEQ
jgi:hypothetical protein